MPCFSRSSRHSHTGFVTETMIDELALAAGRDPVTFRLDLLANQPRAAVVVRLAAEKSGWDRPFQSGPGRGRGFAYHHSFNTRVAMVAEVSVTPKTVKVERVVAAVDCGVAVNPDVVTAQVEGAIGFALSAVLRNRITLNDGMVQQRNFKSGAPEICAHEDSEHSSACRACTLFAHHNRLDFPDEALVLRCGVSNFRSVPLQF